MKGKKGRKSIFIIVICLWKPSTQRHRAGQIFINNLSATSLNTEQWFRGIPNDSVVASSDLLNLEIECDNLKSFFMLQFSTKKKPLQCYVTSEWVRDAIICTFRLILMEGNVSKCGKRVLSHLENEWTWMSIKAIPAVASDLLDLENLGRSDVKDLQTWRSIILSHNRLKVL